MLTKECAQQRFIEPMYAEAARELPDGDDWTYQAKLDGFHGKACCALGITDLLFHLGKTVLHHRMRL